MPIHYQSDLLKRDLRLDFMRGYFVFVMIIDHLGMFPAWTRVLTGGGQLWVSAAEGFILISGLIVGTTYRRHITQKGWRWSVTKIGRRALQLYVLGAAGRLILTTGDYLLRLFWERPSPLPVNYWYLFEGAVFQAYYLFPYVDLLPTYALLLLSGLAAVYFLSQGKWRWVILGSFLLWYAGRIDPDGLHLFRLYFPPVIWQFLFILGVVIGYCRDEMSHWLAERPLPPRLVSILLIGTTAAFLIISYRITFHGLWAEANWLQYDSWLFEKALLAPGRLIATVWIFAGTYELITQFWGMWQRLFGWLLLPLGQNALIAYIAHGFLWYIVTRLPGYPFPNHNPLVMGVIHLSAVLLIWGLTIVIARWTRAKPKTAVAHT